MTETDPVWCTPEQVDALRDACLTDAFQPQQQDRNDSIIALLYDTGLRVSELTALKMEHLHLDDGLVILPPEIQKTYMQSQPHVTRIELGKYGADSTRSLKKYLKHRDSDSEYVYPSRQGGELSTQSVRNLIKKAAVVAEIEPYKIDGTQTDPERMHPHALRHSLAYRIIDCQDGTFDDVKKRLRHKRLSTTEDTYSHFLTV